MAIAPVATARAQVCPPLPGPGADVPLALFTSPNFPTGFAFGPTLGVSFGDFDADGWIDIYVNLTGDLWRSVDGKDFVLATNLNNGPIIARYGASFGDFNNDGLPDLACEPRPQSDFRLFRNEGGAVFTDISKDPTLMNVTPFMDASETACWGDVDFDGDLDLFLPSYPPEFFGVGRQDNYFWQNQGPTGPGGQYHFTEISRQANLGVPIGNNRPEGAQLCDVDGDGDLDLYSNGALYRNECRPGLVRFVPMSTKGNGIGLSGVLDEGALFFDYDLDGDFDLACNYVVDGTVIWENRGDGTFFKIEADAIDCSLLGRDFGMSAADWDNDGDIDFTTQFMWRKNMLVETGQRKFIVASHNLPLPHIERAQPAWGDFDRDGDLDCALGNFSITQPAPSGHLYQSTLYDASTPAVERRYVRVKPVRDDGNVDAGLETEYGATVEIRVAGETGIKRRKFTASGHGYLNQSEYALHFAMPPRGAGLTTFDVVVDFQGDPKAGLWRVDKHVNPILGGIELERLRDREIVVYRSGRVRIDGCDVQPTGEDPALTTTARGLSMPGPNTPLPGLVASPVERWVGVEFVVGAAPQRIADVVLDGELAPGVPVNVVLWDLTGFPTLVESMDAPPNPRNRRSVIAVDWVAEPGRRYRLAAKVVAERSTAIAGPLTANGLTLEGGIRYADPGTPSPAAAVVALVDRGAVHMALRHRAVQRGVAVNIGGGFSESATPGLLGPTGPLAAGAEFPMLLSGAPANVPVFLVLGLDVMCLGSGDPGLVPNATAVAPMPFPTDPTGSSLLKLLIPQIGIDVAVQLWYLDPAASAGFGASNVLLLRLP